MRGIQTETKAREEFAARVIADREAEKARENERNIQHMGRVFLWSLRQMAPAPT